MIASSAPRPAACHETEGHELMSKRITAGLLRAAGAVQAQSPSVAWSNSYTFSGVSRDQTTMQPAEMIETRRG